LTTPEGVAAISRWQLPPEPAIPGKCTPVACGESGTPAGVQFRIDTDPVVARKKRAHHRRLADTPSGVRHRFT